jgi:hypothetical protein
MNQVSPPCRTTAVPAVGDRVGVERPLEAVGRAGLAGEVRGRRARHQENTLPFPGDFLHGQRHRGGRHVDDGVDVIDVDPLARDAGAEVGLVLVIRGNDLDRDAQHRSAEIFLRHVRCEHRALAADPGQQARHVVEHAELDDLIGDLGLGTARRKREQSRAKNAESLHVRLPIPRATRPTPASQRMRGRPLIWRKERQIPRTRI